MEAMASSVDRASTARSTGFGDSIALAGASAADALAPSGAALPPSADAAVAPSAGLEWHKGNNAFVRHFKTIS